ncbi:MAG: Asp-tRNA(Asn)/Glu-tRNA(Gln) amidotransferase subunit GatB [Candidatus Coatesbacteria bacterium]|nr:MAG: Asp-tRNA(Asn)/Glu-tRNA(Gln) amidotransferase subunit GatB [Candidatus Coatesbacteria bacterium]
MVAYVPTIGLEVHVQLKTRTKCFCSCPVVFGAEPNTATCPVCLGHPGSLPVLNREAYRLTLRTALALGCRIEERAVFDRKHYFYPDLPKGFQISQHFTAVGYDGHVTVWSEDGFRDIPVERVHLEEDTAKAIHEEAFVPPGKTYLDFNRCGVPLMEVVGYPAIANPAEARRYLVALRATLVETGVSDCDLEKGSFRIDTNISVRQEGTEEFGTPVEVKNLNSFRSVERALGYELERQSAVLEGGGEVARETRHWDERAEETYVSRTKEERADYRYFPEPDLPPLAVTEEFIDEAGVDLPSAPADRVKDLLVNYEVNVAEAETLAFAEGYYSFLKAAVERYAGDRRKVINWLLGDVTRELKERNVELPDSKLEPRALAEILTLLDDGKVNTPGAREILAAVLDGAGAPTDVMRKKGLEQVSDAGELEEIVRRAVEANPKAVADIRGGKEKAKGAIVGFVMKETGGRANPKLVGELIDTVMLDVD